jgi:hypothetical protein
MRRRLALAFVVMGGFAATSFPAGAQGCSQCLDSTVSASPATQRAYAHAIEGMIAAVGVFLSATAVMIYRSR